MSLKASNKIDTNRYELEVQVDAEAFEKAVNDTYLKERKKIALPHNLLYKLVIGRNAPLVQLHRNAPVPVAPFVFQKYFSYNFFQGSVLFWLIHLFQGVIIGAPGYPCQQIGRAHV